MQAYRIDESQWKALFKENCRRDFAATTVQMDEGLLEEYAEAAYAIQTLPDCVGDTLVTMQDFILTELITKEFPVPLIISTLCEKMGKDPSELVNRMLRFSAAYLRSALVLFKA